MHIVVSLFCAVVWEVLKLLGQYEYSLIMSVESLSSKVVGQDGWVLAVKLFLVALSFYLALFAIGTSKRQAREIEVLRISFENVFKDNIFKNKDIRFACLDYVIDDKKEELLPLNEINQENQPKNNGYTKVIAIGDVIKYFNNAKKEEDDDAKRIIQATLRAYQITQQIKSAEDELTRQTDMLYEQYLGKLAWPNFARIALPMLGFLGTVIGIMISMSTLSVDIGKVLDSGAQTTGGNDKILSAIINLIGQIGVAFDTTVIALVLTFFVLARITRAQTRIDQEVRKIYRSFDPVFQRLTVPNWSKITERYIESAFSRARTKDLNEQGRM